MARSVFDAPKVIPQPAPGERQQLYAFLLRYSSCELCGCVYSEADVRYYEDVVDRTTGEISLSRCPKGTWWTAKGPHTAESAALGLAGNWGTHATTRDVERLALKGFRSSD